MSAKIAIFLLLSFSVMFLLACNLAVQKTGFPTGPGASPSPSCRSAPEGGEPPHCSYWDSDSCRWVFECVPPATCQKTDKIPGGRCCGTHEEACALRIELSEEEQEEWDIEEDYIIIEVCCDLTTNFCNTADPEYDFGLCEEKCEEGFADCSGGWSCNCPLETHRCSPEGICAEYIDNPDPPEGGCDPETEGNEPFVACVECEADDTSDYSFRKEEYLCQEYYDPDLGEYVYKWQLVNVYNCGTCYPLESS